MSKRKSSSIIEGLYSFIGKCVIYSGCFCILFYLFGKFYNYLEPHLSSALNVVISNIQWILVASFLSFSVVWIFLRALDVVDNKIAMKRLNERLEKERLNVMDLN